MIQQSEYKRSRHAARLAVRAYAKDPTDNNADEVHAAWKTVREMDEFSFREKWIGTMTAVRMPMRSGRKAIERKIG
jgi:hypothetical protein